MVATLRTDFTPGPGGVMTEDVGVITGELTLCTVLTPAAPEATGVELVLRVRYKNAAEWYTVSGGRCHLADAGAAAAVHELAVGVLSRGGPMSPESAGWVPETAGGH